MKRTLLAALLLTAFALPAFAGSLKLVYTNDAGVATYSPSATISNADAATIVTWLQTHYAASAACTTALGCFNTYADDVFNQLRTNVQQSQQTAATNAAVAGVAGPTVTPNQ